MKPNSNLKTQPSSCVSTTFLRSIYFRATSCHFHGLSTVQAHCPRYTGWDKWRACSFSRWVQRSRTHSAGHVAELWFKHPRSDPQCLAWERWANCLATQVMNPFKSHTAWLLPLLSFLICHCQRFSWVSVSFLYHFLRSRTEPLLPSVISPKHST